MSPGSGKERLDVRRITGRVSEVSFRWPMSWFHRISVPWKGHCATAADRSPGKHHPRGSSSVASTRLVASGRPNVPTLVVASPTETSGSFTSLTR